MAWLLLRLSYLKDIPSSTALVSITLPGQVLFSALDGLISVTVHSIKAGGQTDSPIAQSGRADSVGP